MKTRNYQFLLAAVLINAAVIYCYPLFLPTPLLDPDEGLHASIAQEMVEGGDYLIPRIQGEPFLDKPILYFASQAISLRMFGMNEAAIRLPGFLFALFGVFTTALLARRLFDQQTAIITALVSLTMAIPFALAQAAVHDIALVPFTNLLLLSWWEADKSKSRKRQFLFSAAAAISIALSLLAKGLIGVALVSVGYCFYVIFNKQVSFKLIARFAIGMLFGFALASPWFLTMEFNSPGYLWYYFITRHFGGFATTDQPHGTEHWSYYLPVLIGGSMPWILYVFNGLRQSWIDHKEGNVKETRAVLFLLCWWIGGMLFLSAASSKLMTYCLPLFPAIAILAGRSIQRFLERDLATTIEAAFSNLYQSIGYFGCIAPIAVLIGSDVYQESRSSVAVYLGVIFASATTVMAIKLMRQNQRHAAVATGSLWIAILFFTAMTWPLQQVAEQFSQRSLGLQLSKRTNLPKKIILMGERTASVRFYLTPEQRESLRPRQLVAKSVQQIRDWSNLPTGTLLIMNEKARRKLEDPVAIELSKKGELVRDFRIIEPATILAHGREKRLR